MLKKAEGSEPEFQSNVISLHTPGVVDSVTAVSGVPSILS